MNREQAKQLLPIIQAFADGSELQVHDTMDGQWLDIKDPWFNDGPERYRVKPKPVERWVLDEVCVGPAFLTREGAEARTREFIIPPRIVHMREVTE